MILNLLKRQIFKANIKVEKQKKISYYSMFTHNVKYNTSQLSKRWLVIQYLSMHRLNPNAISLLVPDKVP